MKITKSEFIELVDEYKEVIDWANDTIDEGVLSENYVFEEIPLRSAFTFIFDTIGNKCQDELGYDYTLEDVISDNFVYGNPKDREKAFDEAYNTWVKNECKENENGRE